MAACICEYFVALLTNQCLAMESNAYEQQQRERKKNMQTKFQHFEYFHWHHSCVRLWMMLMIMLYNRIVHIAKTNSTDSHTTVHLKFKYHFYLINTLSILALMQQNHILNTMQFHRRMFIYNGFCSNLLEINSHCLSTRIPTDIYFIYAFCVCVCVY